MTGRILSTSCCGAVFCKERERMLAIFSCMSASVSRSVSHFVLRSISQSTTFPLAHTLTSLAGSLTRGIHAVVIGTTIVTQDDIQMRCPSSVRLQLESTHQNICQMLFTVMGRLLRYQTDFEVSTTIHKNVLQDPPFPRRIQEEESCPASMHRYTQKRTSYMHAHTYTATATAADTTIQSTKDSPQASSCSLRCC